MAEILFRGRRIDNGEWVEGDYGRFHGNDSHEIYISYPQINETYWNEIDPETICEYINYEDRDKTPIFTNDIVEFSWYDQFWNSYHYVGCIYKGKGCYKISTKNEVYYIDESIDIDKVIGNKFDNAELLGK